MKRILLVLFITTFVFQNIYAQTDNGDLILFSKGNTLYELVYEELDIDYLIEDLDTTDIEEKIELRILKETKESILEKSLEYFEELLDEYPKSKLKYRAMNNAALISKNLDYTDEAIKYYKEIIESKANDKENGGIGSGIMAEPYALYKNRACKNLAEIYLKEKEFESALKYINLTKKYPYQHFCGNEYASNDIYVATLYTKNYIGKGNIEKALEYSLPHAFNNGLASNTEILDITINLIKSKYTKTEIQTELNKAINSIKIKKRKEYNYSTIEIFGHTVELPNEDFLFSLDSQIDFDELEKLSEIEKSKRIFKLSEFYKELIK
jgi:tetratricopeptide (TPR) repeat protein